MEGETKNGRPQFLKCGCVPVVQLIKRFQVLQSSSPSEKHIVTYADNVVVALIGDLAKYFQNTKGGAARIKL